MVKDVCASINTSLGKWLTPCVIVGALLVLVVLWLVRGNNTVVLAAPVKSGFMGNAPGMSNYPEVFTMFKVDWCPHCNKAAPEWEAMKDEVKATGLPVKVQEVDGDKMPGTVKQAGVSAFPTMIYKKGNNEVKYDGPRDAQSLTNFVQQMVATPAPTLRPSAVPRATGVPSFAAPIPSAVATMRPSMVPSMAASM